MKAVYYICNDPDWGHVTGHVWNILKEEGYLENPTDIRCDGDTVYKYEAGGNEFWLVPTDFAICLDYEKYLPVMNEYFADFDMAGMVTWHEGAAAMENVLTCHSIGDMDSGHFSKGAPRFMRNIMRAMRRNLDALGYDHYAVSTEGTHWSGVHNGIGKPELIEEYPVPIVDIEVGSDPSSWDDVNACRALTRSLFEMFNDDGAKLHNLLCVGGVHFDPNFAAAVFTDWDGTEGTESFGVSHILANQWLVTGDYGSDEGFEKAVNCVEAIDGGIDAVVMHDKAKADFKNMARSIAEKYGVPVFKHQKLRKPESLGL